MSTIYEEIESLPPLPETVIEVNKFKLKKDKEIEELTKILEKDPLVVSNVIKVANSAMFGFRHPIETFSRAVQMLGMNMTISLTLSIHINNHINLDVNCYGLSKDKFINKINTTASIVKLWASKADRRLTDTIVLPSLIMEIGKFVISNYLTKLNKSDEFFEYLKTHTITETELHFLGETSYSISAKVFKHWKLSSNLINAIEFMDTPENCPEEDKVVAKYLKVVSIVTDIKNYNNEISQKESQLLCNKFGLNYKLLDEILLDF